MGGIVGTTSGCEREGGGHGGERTRQWWKDGMWQCELTPPIKGQALGLGAGGVAEADESALTFPPVYAQATEATASDRKSVV